MKIIDNTLEAFSPGYPLERLCDLENALFIDIETTGFTARSSDLYLIGCAYHAENTWHTRQWLAQVPSEQAEILEDFFSFAKNKSYLIHFNGSQFDLPYLIQKCQQLGLSHDFSAFDGIDVYRSLFHYKDFLGLQSLKQKSLEAFLSLGREDQYGGGELIEVYRDYVKTQSPEALRLLLLHNAEDLKGMLLLLPMLSYHDAFHFPLKAKRVQANHYCDAYGNPCMELIIYAALPNAVPKSVSASRDGIYARLEGDELAIRVPVFEEEMKYFHANYKDYYYLPKEDVALHKSVAAYVDKDFRQPATARNCYARKQSLFLPEWDSSFNPVFKRSYDDNALFFELTDDLKTDEEAFGKYCSMLLNHVAG